MAQETTTAQPMAAEFIAAEPMAAEPTSADHMAAEPAAPEQPAEDAQPDAMQDSPAPQPEDVVCMQTKEDATVQVMLLSPLGTAPSFLAARDRIEHSGILW
jgi:hypothetical protein